MRHPLFDVEWQARPSAIHVAKHHHESYYRPHGPGERRDLGSRSMGVGVFDTRLCKNGETELRKGGGDCIAGVDLGHKLGLSDHLKSGQESYHGQKVGLKRRRGLV